MIWLDREIPREKINRMNRRKLAKRAALALGGMALLGVGYPLLEAKWCQVARQTIKVPNLPREFQGKTVAFLTDVHHGPFVPRAYIRSVVEMTNALRPDIVALGGDYVHRDRKYISPCFAELGRLRAPLGRFAVLGNHDHWEGANETRAALAEAGVTDLTNTGAWIDQGLRRLRIGGLGDLWEDRQDLVSAIGDATRDDALILLSHNPDVVETLTDRRIGLVLSGHTHGGQVVLPGYGAPRVPSRYGQKYLYGLVQGPVAQVYVSRGVGTITPPVRLFCRPEVALLTLA